MTETSVPAFEPLQTMHNLQNALDLSNQKPIILFKHSSTCPISSEAFDEMSGFIDVSDTPVFLLIVQDSKDLAHTIAEQLDVTHESPQVIVVYKNDVVWDASHYEITQKNVMKIIESVTKTA